MLHWLRGKILVVLSLEPAGVDVLLPKEINVSFDDNLNGRHCDAITLKLALQDGHKLQFKLLPDKSSSGEKWLTQIMYILAYININFTYSKNQYSVPSSADIGISLQLKGKHVDFIKNTLVFSETHKVEDKDEDNSMYTSK